MITHMVLVDLRGRHRRVPLPSPISFIFIQFWVKMWPNNSLEVGTPRSGKSWITGKYNNTKKSIE